jgi:cytidine deaminase
MMLAIAARNEKGELQDEPVSPCGPCRQVIIETETRFKQPVRILLYGKKHIFIVDGIRQLMPLSFTEF